MTKRKGSDLTCFCCGAELTAPQIFNGKAYGWTCITKVSDQKRTRSKDVWVKADKMELIEIDVNTVKVVATIKNATYSSLLKYGRGYNADVLPDSMMVRVYAQYGKQYGNKMVASLVWKKLEIKDGELKPNAKSVHDKYRNIVDVNGDIIATM